MSDETKSPLEAADQTHSSRGAAVGEAIAVVANPAALAVGIELTSGRPTDRKDRRGKLRWTLR